ncbi:MAG: hypothetical protein K8I27_17420 [Planctomycetes bacterium]|nr:hypothetical protein [Planctomycetota bacterium]
MPNFIKFGCATVILALITSLSNAANSTVTHTMVTQTPTQTIDWPDPAGGSLNGYAGDVWATGAGSLFDGDDDTYNGWVTTEADALYIAVNYPEYQSVWKLTGAGYAGSVEASTFYVPTGVLPDEENYRSEATGTAEIRGDFRYFEEKQVAVDSYSRTVGWSLYDAVGGGKNPISYTDGGLYSVFRAQTDKKTTNQLSFGFPVASQYLYADAVQFNLYSRGKQYMHCDKEEDVSLATRVIANRLQDSIDPVGWYGHLTSYDRWLDGTETLVTVHPIG